MSARDDAVKAAAEALYRGGLDRDDAMSRARLAVDAAAPHLLAGAQLVIDTLTATTQMRQEQTERLIDECARWRALCDQKQAWFDGVKSEAAATGYADGPPYAHTLVDGSGSWHTVTLNPPEPSIAEQVLEERRRQAEADLRERLAAAIEERCGCAAEGLDPGQCEYMTAARIVRERP